jgi:hypothetical protein
MPVQQLPEEVELWLLRQIQQILAAIVVSALYRRVDGAQLLHQLLLG